MGVRVTVTWEGIDTVIANLTAIGDKAEPGIQTHLDRLAQDAKDAWQTATHVRSGKLRGGEIAQIGVLSFTLNNAVRYYDWVNDGHWTPRGWHTRRGYRLAKRRSHVPGQEMTEKAVAFIDGNIEEYLSHFLDDA